MKIRNIILILVVFCTLSVFPHINTSNAISNLDSARELAEKFCRAEFMGVEDIRLDIAKYSQKQMLLEKKEILNSEGW